MHLEAHLNRLCAGDRVLARDLRLAVDRGRCLVVRGPSGAGKSLLLRALAGLDPLDGTLALQGQGPASLGWPRWRSRVARLPQEIPRLPGTPADLHRRLSRVGFPPERHAPAPGALGLTPAQLHQPWTELSGGERRRALLCLILARRPEVLLLDEPTTGLDGAAREALMQAVDGVTAVWVTHHDAVARRVAHDVLELG
jgi:ABC-type iron transport system FetAB ATPase subunit